MKYNRQTAGITGRQEKKYSLRFILIDFNMDVSRTKICLDTSILESINMNRREYYEDQQRNRKATEKLPVIAGFDT
jgi:hypothetical protein